MSKKLRDVATMRDVIGIFLVLAFIGAMVALLWKAIPHDNEQLLAYMLGQLSGFVAGVVGYHYVKGSGDEALAKQRSDNTAKAFEAVTAAAKARTNPAAGEIEPDVTLKPGETAQAEPSEED